jgi:hypothetical protein
MLSSIRERGVFVWCIRPEYPLLNPVSYNRNNTSDDCEGQGTSKTFLNPTCTWRATQGYHNGCVYRLNHWCTIRSHWSYTHIYRTSDAINIPWILNSSGLRKALTLGFNTYIPNQWYPYSCLCILHYNQLLSST